MNNNTSPLTTLRNNKRQLVVLSILLLIAIAAFLFISYFNSFRVISVTPSSNETVSHNAAEITFSFNEPLSEIGRDEVLFSITPRADFLFRYGEDSITLSLRDVPFTETYSYEVTLKNITSESGASISETTAELNLELNDTLKDLYSQLPISTDAYSISIADGDTLFVESPLLTDIDTALDFLSSYGVNEDVFKVRTYTQESFEGFDSA